MYWEKNGKEQAKYDEMVNAGWEFTKKTETVFHSYYRYYNDGDLPGWARSRYDLTKYSDEYGWRHRTFNIKGQRELEDRVSEAILVEYKRFQKAMKN